MNKLIDKIIDIIKKNQKFLIVAHGNMDGDSIGSALALGLALKKMGKDIRILLNESVPTRYKFLPGLAELTVKSSPPMFIRKQDVLFVLDTAGWAQMEKFKPEQFEKQIVVNIDHHIDNNKFGYINWVDPQAGAVGEQIYNLLKEMSIPITRDIAVCLYTAILTDTGGFQYSNVTHKTHRIISKILPCGIQPHIISEQIYENISLSKLKLLQLALRTLKSQNQIIWICVTRKMLKEAHGKRSDTDGFIDYLKAVRGNKIAMVLKEGSKHGEIRVTFRSKDPRIFVNEIAHQFGGGGHPAAAGCTVWGSMKEVEKKVLKAVKTILRQKVKG